jgi:hypothetical protein
LQYKDQEISVPASGGGSEVTASADD